MKKFIIAALVLVACSAEPATPEEVAEVQQGVCSQLSCPYVPAYPTFMYAINYSTSIVCWYRNNIWQTSSVTLQKAPHCGTCCAVGYCPDQRIGQTTYSGTWSCTSP